MFSELIGLKILRSILIDLLFTLNAFLLIRFIISAIFFLGQNIDFIQISSDLKTEGQQNSFSKSISKNIFQSWDKGERYRLKRT